MRYYVVVDTNVLVSALLRGASVPGVILREALEEYAKEIHLE